VVYTLVHLVLGGPFDVVIYFILASSKKKKLLRERVIIQASCKGGEYTFYFSREGSIYFNIRGVESVIQESLKRGGCNLL